MKTSRRDFVRLALTSAATAGIAPAILTFDRSADGLRVGPNDTLRLGLIGMGIIGLYDIEVATRLPGTQIVAMADVYDARRNRAKELFGKDLFTTRDYREVLARPDVDAVIIAVPDHWHARIAIDALAAGKHVYLEKPMVQDIDEGPQVIEAWKKSGKVLQVGSQSASAATYLKAKEFYEAGLIGELNMVEATNSRNSDVGAWQYSMAPSASPANLDWEMFLGNAPKRDFDPVRYFRWRNYWDYGTGIAGDLYVHQFTGLHTVVNTVGPTSIMALGGLRFWEDGREVPDVLQSVYDYPETDTHPGFTVSLRVNLADGSVGETPDMRFSGSEGMINVYGNRVTVTHRPIQRADEFQLVRGYNSVRSWDEATQKEYIDWLRKQPKPAADSEPQSQEYRVPDGNDARTLHFTNFFTAIRTAGKVLEDPVFGYRAAAPSLLANQSYLEKRMIQWDPTAMKLA